MNKFSLLVLLFYCNGVPAAPLESLIEKSGLQLSDIKIDSINRKAFGGIDGELPIVSILRDEPLRIPFYSGILREDVFTNLNSLTKLFVSASARMNQAVRRNLVGDPLAAAKVNSQKPQSLVFAISKIHKISGSVLSGAKLEQLKAMAAKMPAELTQTAAYLLEAELQALEWRNKALLKTNKSSMQKLFNKTLTASEAVAVNSMSAIDPLLMELSTQVDFKYLMAGATDLIYGIEQALPELEKLPLKKNSNFIWKTPLGVIEVQADSQNNVYSAKDHYLLIIDLAGDDTYEQAGGNSQLDKALSVVIDLKGNDSYVGKGFRHDQSVAEYKARAKLNSPAFGAGFFGYGVVVDNEGSDIYRAGSYSMGAGFFGVGLLWDRQGQDHYDCYTNCQGAGQWGVGLLIDNSGTDRYDSFQKSQGYGGPTGSGYLVDAGEDNDTYLANTTQLDFPAMIDKKFNTSMAQGFGEGLRADIIDGHSMAGGFGALFDGGGDNTFTAGFYAQGSTYWYAAGILSSGSGNDVYSAGKYAQGAGVHYSVGILHDLGGNDHYKVVQELGLGEGHDFSSGFLIDEAGDDVYEAPNLSLGSASGSGVGIFWDKSGDDIYTMSESLAFGGAGLRVQTPSLREYSPTIGLFFDSGGSNTFNTKLKAPSGKMRSGSWRTVAENEGRTPHRLIGFGLVGN